MALENAEQRRVRVRRKLSSNKQRLDLAPRPARLRIGLRRLRFFLVALAEIDDHARVGVFAEEIRVFGSDATVCRPERAADDADAPQGRGYNVYDMAWLLQPRSIPVSEPSTNPCRCSRGA